MLIFALRNSLWALLFIVFPYLSAAQAAIQLQQTRLIYPAGKPSVAIAIRNTDNRHAVAVESWIESDKPGIMIKPAKVVIPPESTREVNIHIPDDRHLLKQEVLYWLDIKAIPLPEGAKNKQMAISVINRIKVFYRPQFLKLSAAEADNYLVVRVCNKKLTIENPTPYYINFYSFTLDNQEVKQIKIVAPYETLAVSLPAAGKYSKAGWQVISDTGFHNRSMFKEVITGC